MMNIPKGYNELTVQQLVELELLKEQKLDALDSAVKRLSIVTGKSVEEIEDLSPTAVYGYIQRLLWMSAPVTEMKVNKTIVLGFKKFRLIDKNSSFNVAQSRDIATYLEMNGNNYVKCLPEILSIIHEELTLFGFKYKPENHFKNIELFKSAKCSDVLGAVFFYSNFWNSYNKIISTYLEQREKEINEIVNEMNLDKGFRDFLNNGGGITQ